MSSTTAPVKTPKRDKAETFSPERLAWWRHARGLSVRDLAEKSGYGKSHISGLEHGNARPTARCLAALAGALSCDTTDLMPALPDGIPS